MSHTIPTSQTAQISSSATSFSNWCNRGGDPHRTPPQQIQGAKTQAQQSNKLKLSCYQCKQLQIHEDGSSSQWDRMARRVMSPRRDDERPTIVAPLSYGTHRGGKPCRCRMQDIVRSADLGRKYSGQLSLVWNFAKLIMHRSYWIIL